MRLSELQAPPKDIRDYKHQNPGRLISSWQREVDGMLEKYGYKLLGRGSFGRVYKNNRQNKVLKVFIEDIEYMRWVKFCKEHPNNPYLPKFKSQFIRLKQDPPIYGILIEELTKYEDYNMAYLLSGLVSFWGDEENMKFLRKQYGNIDKFLQDENLIQAVEFLHTHKDAVDIKSENIMSRNGQLVITDPLA